MNEEQRAAWNGESGVRWVANADRRDAVLAPVADLLLTAAAIEPGTRVLDIGCGCGATTLAAAEAARASGHVVGVDLSAPMLDLARRRARGVGHVELVVADVQTDALGGPHDVATSRFGTMFVDDPGAAFANVARHLRAGGRLCVATWQDLTANAWLAVPGAALVGVGAAPMDDAGRPGMFAQSDPEAIRTVLEGAGFVDVVCEPHTLGLVFGSTLEEAADYLVDTGPGRAALASIEPERRDDAVAAVRAALAPHHRPGRGVVLDAGVLVTTAVRA